MLISIDTRLKNLLDQNHLFFIVNETLIFLETFFTRFQKNYF